MKHINDNNICQKGNILLELALILPLLLLLIAGIVQFGFILNAKIAVNSASYEAARAATLSEDPSATALKVAKDYAGSNLPGWDYNDRLEVRTNIAGNAPGDPINVEVIYQVPLFFKNISSLAGDENSMIEVKGASVMRVEEKE